MLGGDPLYDAARLVLLDALEALGPHRDCVTLIGAQAIYLRTGESGLAVAPTTTDADLAIDPSGLGMEPAIDRAMEEAGFRLRNRADGPEPGIWEKTIGAGHLVTVDLLVAEGLTGNRSRRSARLDGHHKHTARQVSGIEGALVDADMMGVHGPDGRGFEIRVAGPAAMLVAKTWKIGEREASRPTRLKDKDALDLFRLVRGTPTADLVARTRRMMADPRSRNSVEWAVERLPALFGEDRGAGVAMAARAAGGLIPEDEIRASLVALIRDYLGELEGHK